MGGLRTIVGVAEIPTGGSSTTWAWAAAPSSIGAIPRKTLVENQLMEPPSGSFAA
jgi:hypothetical protein